MHGLLSVDGAQFTTSDTEIEVWGRIEATATDFTGYRLKLYDGSLGYVRSSNLLGSFHIVNETGGVDIQGNDFYANNPAYSVGKYVEDFHDNSFLSPSPTLWIKWGTDQNVMLKTMGNLSRYRIYGGDFVVDPAATMIVKPGVEISSDRHDYELKIQGELNGFGSDICRCRCRNPGRKTVVS